jgi:hypothetical protein
LIGESYRFYRKKSYFWCGMLIWKLEMISYNR